MGIVLFIGFFGGGVGGARIRGRTQKLNYFPFPPPLPFPRKRESPDDWGRASNARTAPLMGKGAGGRYLSHRRIARVFCLRTIPSAYGTTTLAVGVSVPITSSPWRCALVFQTRYSPCLSPRYSRYAALAVSVGVKGKHQNEIPVIIATLQSPSACC